MNSREAHKMILERFQGHATRCIFDESDCLTDDWRFRIGEENIWCDVDLESTRGYSVSARLPTGHYSAELYPTLGRALDRVAEVLGAWLSQEAP